MFDIPNRGSDLIHNANLTFALREFKMRLSRLSTSHDEWSPHTAPGESVEFGEIQLHTTPTADDESAANGTDRPAHPDPRLALQRCPVSSRSLHPTTRRRTTPNPGSS